MKTFAQAARVPVNSGLADRMLSRSVWSPVGLALTWLLIGATPLIGADAAWQFTKDVSVATRNEESLASLRLDADVYGATQDGLADVRLLDADGTAVPFLLRKSQELRPLTVRRKTWTARKPQLRPLESGGLEITIVLDKDDPQPNGLSLITPLQNFEQRVSVFSSADGQDWQPAGEGAAIFDYSRYMDVRNDSIHFPATAHRHLRIVVDDVTSEQQSELMELTRRLRGGSETERTETVTIDRRPFRIERIDFWQEESVEGVEGDHKQPYPIVGFTVEQEAKRRQTIVTIETRREPLTSLTLQTASRNFSRHCAVEVPEQRGVQSTWRPVGSVTLSRIEFKTLKREELTITFPESRHSRFRLVIDDRDSAPLSVTGIAAEGNVYEMVFLTAPGKGYRLVYGDPDATAAKYDTAAIEALLTERYRPEQATIGPQLNVSGVSQRGFKWSDAINDPRILTGVIGLLVLLLGWGLYAAVKRLDHPPP